MADTQKTTSIFDAPMLALTNKQITAKTFKGLTAVVYTALVLVTLLIIGFMSSGAVQIPCAPIVKKWSLNKDLTTANQINFVPTAAIALGLNTLGNRNDATKVAADCDLVIKMATNVKGGKDMLDGLTI